MAVIKWYQKEHPCNGRFHWRWYASEILIKLEGLLGEVSSRVNDLRRRKIERVADPVITEES